MNERFDILYAGALLPTYARDDVKNGLQRLFKIAPDMAETLLSGTQHRIKANCDEATMRQYQQALRGIGADVIIVRQDTPKDAGTDSPTADSASEEISGSVSPEPSNPASAAVSTYDDAGTLESATVKANTLKADPPAADQSDPLPEGSNVAPTSAPQQSPQDARETPQEAFSLAPLGERLAPSPEHITAAVMVPPFTLAPVGDKIPTLQATVAPVTPRTDHLTLATLPADDG
jgi:hypothetical protein